MSCSSLLLVLHSVDMLSSTTEDNWPDDLLRCRMGCMVVFLFDYVSSAPQSVALVMRHSTRSRLLTFDVSSSVYGCCLNSTVFLLTVMESGHSVSKARQEQSDCQYQFYETLVLMSLLLSGQTPRSKPRRTAWHRFLDDLSYLCDAETGGKSVSSIAVQQNDDMLVFWISANGGLRRACQHLRWSLKQLAGCNYSQISAAETRAELLGKTTEMSSRKVRNYVRELQLHISQAERLRPMPAEGDFFVSNFEYAYLHC